METGQATEPDERSSHSGITWRGKLIAAGVILLVVSYIGGIVFGFLPEKQKLGGPEIGILLVGVIVVLLLLQPRFLDRLTHVKVGSVEVELEKLQRDQQRQRSELDDVRFALTMLLQGNELRHLKSLESGETQGYVGNHDLRTELRRLRTLGLVQNHRDSKIADLTDNGKFDLSRIVELTERGRQYLRRVGDSDTE
jgi:hypothetical protein